MVGSSVKPGPLTEMSPKVSVALPAFTITKVSGALDVPSSCGAKAPTVGSTCSTAATANCPFPASATVCGLPVALLAMVTAPARAPAASGVKVTLNVQVAPAASEEAQAEVKAKSPFTVIEEIARGAVPVLVKVTVCAGLVVEIVRDANVSEDGVSVRPAASATGVTAFEGAEAGPVPTALVALTVKVYAVPFASPVTVIGEAVPVAVMPFGNEVTV